MLNGDLFLKILLSQVSSSQAQNIIEIAISTLHARKMLGNGSQ